jgi:aminopeptidase N
MKPRQRVLLLLACAAASIATAHASSPAPHLDLEVELDPASRRLYARAQVMASAPFVFALHRSLGVVKASAGGQPVEVTQISDSEDRRRWRIMASPTQTLRIEYEGTLPPLDGALDHRSVLSARTPMAAIDGSFLPAGSGWYPRPAPRFTYRVKLTLPGGQRGLVAGRLISETPSSDPNARYEAVFHFEQPAEGIDLMAGPYGIREQLVPRAGAPPIRLRTYFFRDMDALAEHYLADSERYIALYADLIGAYPFSEFSVVASPLPAGFGMPTLTYIGARVLKLPFIRATSLGHEVLHNWWGNGVYVDYERGNWSEGLTTFMADYYYREQQSAASAKEMRLSWLRDFAAVPDDAHRPLAAFRSRTHGAEAALGYGKGAMVFFMLRDEIGAEAFRRGIRDFWSAQRFKVASWSDLQTAFERASSRSLRVFFEQWLNRAGGPTLELEAARLKDVSGKNALVITLKQSPPPYTLRVPFELITKSQTAAHYTALDRERETLTLQPGAVPEGVRLDPDFRLWRRLEPGALPPILRQWIVARAPRIAVVSDSTAVERAARTVAARFLEATPEMISSKDAPRGSGPVLIAGLHADVARTLSAWKLPPAPSANRGSAWVWTVQAREATVPIAVISARDADALEALAHALPHYGAQSYLVFEGSRVVDRGIWPAEVRIIPVTR